MAQRCVHFVWSVTYAFHTPSLIPEAEWWTTSRIEGRALIIHLFEGAQFIQSNCRLSDLECSFCPRQRAIVQPHITPINYHGPIAPNLRTADGTIATSQYPTAAPPAWMYPAVTHPSAEQIATQLRAMQLSGRAATSSQHGYQHQLVPSQPILPVYATSSSGTLINTTYGVARTEFRGVFVKELDFKAQASEVEEFFSRAGKITKCELQTDSHGKSKGTATIQYSTRAEAAFAVRTIDGMRWRNRTLKVRIDQEPTVTENPPKPSSARSTEEQGQPTIVNGSGVYR